MNQPFVPQWADKAMTPKIEFTAHDAAELECLRDFFIAWKLFHSVPNEKQYRKRREEYAQDLTSKAQTIIRMQNPTGNFVVNGKDHG